MRIRTQILGTPAGIYVFINYIYDALKVATPPHYGEAIALSVYVAQQRVTRALSLRGE